MRARVGPPAFRTMPVSFAAATVVFVGPSTASSASNGSRRPLESYFGPDGSGTVGISSFAMRAPAGCGAPGAGATAGVPGAGGKATGAGEVGGEPPHAHIVSDKTTQALGLI